MEQPSSPERPKKKGYSIEYTRPLIETGDGYNPAITLTDDITHELIAKIISGRVYTGLSILEHEANSHIEESKQLLEENLHDDDLEGKRYVDNEKRTIAHWENQLKLVRELWIKNNDRFKITIESYLDEVRTYPNNHSLMECMASCILIPFSSEQEPAKLINIGGHRYTVSSLRVGDTEKYFLTTTDAKMEEVRDKDQPEFIGYRSWYEGRFSIGRYDSYYSDLDHKTGERIESHRIYVDVLVRSKDDLDRATELRDSIAEKIKTMKELEIKEFGLLHEERTDNGWVP